MTFAFLSVLCITIANSFFSIENINHIQLDDEEYLVVADYADNNRPIKFFNLPSMDLESYLSSGEGPGEVSERGFKSFSTIADSLLLVWDAENMRAMIYDTDFNYMSEVAGLEDYRLYYYAAVTDSYAIGISRIAGRDFVEIFTLNHTSNGRFETYREKVVSTPRELINANQNMLLRQGSLSCDENNCVIGFTYSSVIMFFSGNQLLWVSSEPEAYYLPDYDGIETNGGQRVYRAPDLAEHPYGIIDVSVNDEYVFVLYSGKKGPDPSGISGFISRATFDPDEILHSDRLFIYDHEGNFIKEVRLPMEAKTLSVSRNTLKFGSELNQEPVINQFELDSIY